MLGLMPTCKSRVAFLRCRAQLSSRFASALLRLIGTMTRILQLTDFHVFANANAKLKGIPTRESLVDVVQYIQQTERPFDFVVVTGDHTHDELPESYSAVREILEPLSGQLLQVPGNHDDRVVMRDVFTDLPGTGQDRVQFAKEVGEWLLLGLDTHLPGEVAGQIDAGQVDWLKSQIDKSAASSVALFCHHPPIDVGSVWMDQIGLSGREFLQQAVLADKRIRLICCGHVHHEFERELGAAKVMASPSTGIQFDPLGDTPQFANAAPGYRVIELDGFDYQTHVVCLPEVKYSLELD